MDPLSEMRTEEEARKSSVIAEIDGHALYYFEKLKTRTHKKATKIGFMTCTQLISVILHLLVFINTACADDETETGC